MSRPRKCRVISNHPIAEIYKPVGIPAFNLKMATLSVDGLEALRLADVEGLEHTEAAKLMEISRPTFSRILKEAHRIVSTALINGWALSIQGGNFIHEEDMKMQGNKRRCGGQGCGLGLGLRGGMGLGRQANLSVNQSNIIGDEMTKIAISCIGTDLEAKVDPRFGRAGSFLIVNPDTMEFSHLDNSKVNEMGSGAGIQTAEMIAKSGANVVLTGSVGPKAAAALSAAGIKFTQGFDGLSVIEAINKFKANK